MGGAHTEPDALRAALSDRAGVRPIDFDASKEKDERPKFNPRDYSPRELDLIETALRLMLWLAAT